MEASKRLLESADTFNKRGSTVSTTLSNRTNITIYYKNIVIRTNQMIDFYITKISNKTYLVGQAGLLIQFGIKTIVLGFSHSLLRD